MTNEKERSEERIDNPALYRFQTPILVKTLQECIDEVVPIKKQLNLAMEDYHMHVYTKDGEIIKNAILKAWDKIPRASLHVNQKALADFSKIYTLRDGEGVRYLGLDHEEERLAYYYVTKTSQARAIPRGPDAMFFRWDGRLQYVGMTFGGHDLLTLLRMLANIYPYEIEGDQTLIEKHVPGDWIVRAGFSRENIVEAFQKILSKDVGLPLTLNFREVSRKVYVARGEFNFKPIQDRRNIIEIYAEELQDPAYGDAGGGDFNELLQWVGTYTGEWIMSEVEAAPTDNLRWHYNHQNRPWQYNHQNRPSSSNVELVLQHLTEQTGLTFQQETRSVQMLVVQQSN